MTILDYCSAVPLAQLPAETQEPREQELDISLLHFLENEMYT